ncbi:MAG TPA: hypothetical protein VF455_02180 [Chryseobacterium sp.]
MKLFTIGDSISQGFMSGAAAKTELCYSTLIAQQLGIKNYQYPTWPEEGMPVNVEKLFRNLEEKYGSSISTLEWTLALATTIPSYLDTVEKYYERGDGAADKPYPGKIPYFDNVSVRGFNVSDAWLINAKYCKKQIKENSSGNGVFSSVDNSFLRTALRVLNPQLSKEHDEKTQLDWLKYHSDKEGVENVIIWLGSNNALGTIVDLNIHFTEGNGKITDKPSDTFIKESNGKGKEIAYNLWHPKDFEADYTELLDRVDRILEGKNTKVFLGTVPLVTIAPLAKGVGETFTVKVENETEKDKFDDVIYSKYYTYFPFEEDFAAKTGINLGYNQVTHIDRCIRAYNKTIKRLADERNKINPGRYTIIDYSKMLDSMAFKRNGGTPTYKFPSYFDFQYPLPNTKYYHADTDGNLKQGGIFSLDGVHPTAIAHGLIAYETLKIMKDLNVPDADPDKLNWKKIIELDTLYTKPISLMHEIYDNKKLAEWLMDILKKIRKHK